MKVTPGSTDVTTYISLVLASDGSDATGLTATDFDLQYVRSGASPAAKVDASALGATNSAHADNSAIEVDATDQPGLYRVDWPDAAFAVNVREVILTVKHASCRAAHLRVELETIQTGDAFARLGAPAGASQAADIAAVKVDTAAILVDTNELQTDWVNGGRLDLLIDAILLDTGTTLDGRLPAALVGGRMDSNMQAGAVGVISASLLASDAANEIADALLDRADGVETSITLRQTLRAALAAMAGVLSGAATTTITIKTPDGGTTRIVSTVDADGNRSAVTLTL